MSTTRRRHGGGKRVVLIAVLAGINSRRSKSCSALSPEGLSLESIRTKKRFSAKAEVANNMRIGNPNLTYRQKHTNARWSTTSGTSNGDDCVV